MAPVHYIRKADDLPNFRPRCPQPECPGFVATKLCRGTSNRAHKGLWYDVCHTAPESHFLGFRNDIPRGYQPASYNKTSDATETPRKSQSYSYDGRRQNGAVPPGKCVGPIHEDDPNPPRGCRTCTFGFCIRCCKKVQSTTGVSCQHATHGVPPEERPASLRSASPTLETFDPDLESDPLLSYDIDPDLFLIPNDSADSTLLLSTPSGLSLPLPDVNDEPIWLHADNTLFTIPESEPEVLATPPSSPDAPLSISIHVPTAESSNAPNAALPTKTAAPVTRTPSKASASKRSKPKPPALSEEEPVGALSQPYYDMIPAHIHAQSQASAAGKPLSRQAERQSREREAKETVQFWFWRETSKKPRRFDVRCTHWPLFRVLDCSKTVRLALLSEAEHDDPDTLIEMYDPSEDTWLTVEISSCRSVERGVPLLFRAYGLEDGIDMSEKEQSCRSARNPSYSRQGKRPYTATLPDPATPSRSVRPRVRPPSPVSPIQTPTPPSRALGPAQHVPGNSPPLAPLAALQVGDALARVEDGVQPLSAPLSQQGDTTAPTADAAASPDSVAPDDDTLPSTPPEDSYAAVDQSLRLVPASNKGDSKWPLKYVCFMAQGFEAMEQLSGTQPQKFEAAFPGCGKLHRTTFWKNEQAWKKASQSQRQRYVDAGTSGGLTWPQFFKEAWS
ncbi:hypothetical protein FA95DRAFT_1612883 [Auriscalpium vulgare]|uniref:Uncharacterized protein n=1 Tax=Auriscalpium vulgare TaxID=40419 RepID=A0ACB8R4R5_9AGAM|nr:hypothetical protein FA95DRAFT_1612883 [Auriscalpium vulgare]